MLNKIIVTSEVSIGDLAELLLFYDSVRVFVGEESIRRLFSHADPHVLIPFLEEQREHFELSYVDTSIGVSGGSGSYSSFGICSEWIRSDKQDFIAYTRNGNLDSPSGPIVDKRLAKRFLKTLTRVDYQRTTLDHAFCAPTCGDDLLALVKRHVERTSPAAVGLLSSLSRITIEPQLGGHHYSVIIPGYIERPQWREVVDEALYSFADALTIIDAVAETTGDVLASASTSIALSTTIARVLDRTSSSLAAKNHFVDLAFPEARNVASAIDRGEISFEAFVRFYDKGERFRSWVAELSTDQDLMREYLSMLAREPLLSRLPAKTTRWATFTGLGLAADAMGAGGLGTAAGIAASAFDAFLLERLIKAEWRPNQFIWETKGFLAEQAKAQARGLM